MATNWRSIPAAPEAVWEVLADPASYGHWVVGSKHIRDADAGFPAPGTKFHHAVGVGPLTVRDHTEILEADSPRLLRMRAKARPVGTATVTLELTAHGGETWVRMTENLDGPFAILNPLAHVFIKLRNAESLRRLEELALSASGR
jgi:uncharacterized protein YndB with AHSA1/START domain